MITLVRLSITLLVIANIIYNRIHNNKQTYHLRWLLHYLLGSGKTRKLHIPSIGRYCSGNGNWYVVANSCGTGESYHQSVGKFRYSEKQNRGWDWYIFYPLSDSGYGYMRNLKKKTEYTSCGLGWGFIKTYYIDVRYRRLAEVIVKVVDKGIRTLQASTTYTKITKGNTVVIALHDDLFEKIGKPFLTVITADDVNKHSYFTT